MPPQPNNRIEPGCLCIIKNSSYPELVGRQCTAIKPVPAGAGIVDSVTGNFNRVPELAWKIEIPGEPQCLALARQLQRIDGHKPEADELLDHIPALRRLNSKGASNA